MSETYEPLETAEHKEIKTPKKVEFTVALASHGTKEDADFLSRHIENADIVFLEMAGWDKRHSKIFNQVSSGTLEPDRALQQLGFQDGKHDYFAYIKRVTEILYRSKKVISSLDIPAQMTHELYQSMYEIVRAEYKNEGSFESLLQDFQKALVKFQELQEKRESFMVDKIPSELEKAESINPALAIKDKINALIQIGADHFGLAKKMENLGLEVSSNFLNNPHYYNFIKEFQLRREHGINIDQEDLAKFWLGQRIIHLDFPTSDMQKVVKFVRVALQNFSYEEIKGIHEGIKRKHKFKSNLFRHLEQKGFKFPKTEEQLDQYINNYGTSGK